VIHLLPTLENSWEHFEKRNLYFSSKRVFLSSKWEINIPFWQWNIFFLNKYILSEFSFFQHFSMTVFPVYAWETAAVHLQLSFNHTGKKRGGNLEKKYRVLEKIQIFHKNVHDFLVTCANCYIKMVWYGMVWISVFNYFQLLIPLIDNIYYVW